MYSVRQSNDPYYYDIIYDYYVLFSSTVSRNCADRYKSGERKNGVYTINPDGSEVIEVFCDQTTAGGGWLVFQKRLDGSVDFYRDWSEYKRGFGSLTGEFWLGLDNIHRLTSSGKYKLRVDLEDFAGNVFYAEYDLFEVGSEGEKYTLNVGNYKGLSSLRFLINFQSLQLLLKIVLYKKSFSLASVA